MKIIPAVGYLLVGENSSAFGESARRPALPNANANRIHQGENMKANGQLKIERGVPIPSSGRGKKRGEFALTLTAMKKGDSLFVHKHYQNVQQHCLRYLGKGNYTMRTMDGGIRIWRIK